MVHAHHLCNHFNRTFITEAFAGTNIHLIRNGIQCFLTMYRRPCPWAGIGESSH